MNRQRDVRIAERVARERIADVKRNIAHARQTSQRDAGTESAAAEWWLECALQNARYGRFPTPLGAHREKRVRRIAALVGTIEEFKIAKIGAAA